LQNRFHILLKGDTVFIDKNDLAVVKSPRACNVLSVKKVASADLKRYLATTDTGSPFTELFPTQTLY
jgi:hypothetical protein